jgi:hypothetical protein
MSIQLFETSAKENKNVEEVRGWAILGPWQNLIYHSLASWLFGLEFSGFAHSHQKRYTSCVAFTEVITVYSRTSNSKDVFFETNSENAFLQKWNQWYQWMVISLGFDYLKFLGQFLSPALCDRSHHQSLMS